MTVLLDDQVLQQRRDIASGALAGLATSLATDLGEVRRRGIYLPPQKAMLTRDGGRCSVDGTYLEFDPFNHDEFRCALCGAVYRGEHHYRFWLYWYHLWLAERAVHGAVLSTLGVDESLADVSLEILNGYAERYLGYPNVDDVLGPSRVFFSTYLESIWLLQICLATELLESKYPSLGPAIRERIIQPARDIIAVYDEGGSNRQVWNDVALFAASTMLGDAAAAERAILGASGISAHLTQNLLPDGTWYEGENYHLFAHRGLWYGVTMAERAGIPIDTDGLDRFAKGFLAPFATALPDFTLPSRKDSQYAISLRQWRIAEHCELGVARGAGQTLLGALHRMYDSSIPAGDTSRSRSSADVERNSPSCRLTRDDLSWRALLFAPPELPLGDARLDGSDLLDAQGIAVFRRDRGQVYVALDYGQSGGGHGHPDRLNLLLVDGPTRWLDDFGTGSYVDDTLHWYRSTLAHNAPLINGHSQQRMDGRLLGYDEATDDGWILAQVDDIAPGVSVRRLVMVEDTYVIDVMEWDAERAIVFDLPLHADLQIVDGAGELEDAPLSGGSDLEDGFNFVKASARQLADMLVRARADEGSAHLDLFAHTTVPSEWWRAVAPGPPGRGDRAFRLVRSAARAGRYAFVWSLRGEIESVDFGDSLRAVMTDGTVHEHHWPRVVEPPALEDTEIAVDETREVRAFRLPLEAELGEGNYRRSEQSWIEAGKPTATVRIARVGRDVSIRIDVPHSDLTFVPANATNPYDNENPDINGDGVQVYARTSNGASAWVLVPELDSERVRARVIPGWELPLPLDASWRRTATGYSMSVAIALDEPAVALDVIINEKPNGRERRRGQLVLSGAGGEFVYLRGDRHDPRRLILLDLADA